MFEIAGAPALVGKLYHEALPSLKQEKLRFMATHADKELLTYAAWPTQTLHSSRSGPVIGFLMDRVVDRKPIHMLYGPAHRKQDYPKAAWDFLLYAARNTAAAFEAVHKHGHVLGDVNQGNVMVGNDSRVMLIDSDSMQIAAGGKVHLCEVGVAHFTPPELQGATRFAQVARTANHDGFGLALLIFHLLFGGRHPFAGRPLLDSVGNVLEEDIKAFRFAYGADARRRGFEPPPRSIPFSVAPPPLQALFQRAFTEPGAAARGRPTASEWLAELDRTRSTLKTCGKSRMHVYPAHSGPCPWCQLDLDGAVFFIDLSVFTAQVGSTFVLAQVWAAIESVKAPSALTVPRPADFKVSAEGLPKGVRKGKNRLAMGLVAIAIVLVLAAIFPKAWIVLSLIGFAIWVPLSSGDTKPYLEEMARRKAAKDDAQRQYDNAVSALRLALGTDKFVKEKQALEKHRQTYLNFAVAERNLLEQVKGQARARQLKDHLDRFFIDDAVITGLGPAKKAALRSFGIETAADVEWETVGAVRGFGPKLTGAMMAWKSKCELSFRFDASPKALQVDLARAQAVSNAERAKLEAALRGGVERLGRIRLESDAAAARLLPNASAMARALSQAESDLAM